MFTIMDIFCAFIPICYMSFTLRRAGIPICYMFQNKLRVIPNLLFVLCICSCGFLHPPTLFCVTIYIHLKTIMHVFSITVSLYTYMLLVLYYFLYRYFRLLRIYIFQRILPATNTHTSYVWIIYVLLIPTFGTYNSL